MDKNPNIKKGNKTTKMNNYNLSLQQLTNMSYKELIALQNQFKKESNRRIQRLKDKELIQYSIDYQGIKYRHTDSSYTKSIGKRGKFISYTSRAEIINNLTNMQSFIKSPTSSVTGTRQYIKTIAKGKRGQARLKAVEKSVQESIQFYKIQDLVGLFIDKHPEIVINTDDRYRKIPEIFSDKILTMKDLEEYFGALQEEAEEEKTKFN